LDAVLYEMATGFPAFPQRNIAALVEAVQHQEPPPPTMVNPYMPITLERVIMEALHKDPEKRYQTAVELAEALEAQMPRPGRKETHMRCPGSGDLSRRWAHDRRDARNPKHAMAVFAKRLR
jgi:serine/threonine protein kinase